MNTTPLFPVFCELLLKSVAVLALAGAVNLFWRNASAASRHMLWTLALVALLALPATRLAAPRWTVELPTRTVAAVLPPAPMDLTPVTNHATVAPVNVPAHSPSLPSWRMMLMLAWLAGAGAVLSYRVAGSWRLRGLRRQSEPVTDGRLQSLAAECGLGKRVQLLQSPDCRVPLVWGLWRPVVVLPEVALTWPQARLAAALRHELGHIRRLDSLTLLLAQVVCALYWMNPLVWLAARRLRMAQEQACDDLVLRSGASAADYADLLVQTVRGLGDRGLLGGPALAMAQPSTLASRVASILDDRCNRGPLGSHTRMIGGLAVMALITGCALVQVTDTPDVHGTKTQIEVSTRFVELSEDTIQRIALPTSGTLTDQQMQPLLQKLMTDHAVDILSAPKVTTLPGQEAVIKVVSEVISPTDWEKDTKTGAWKPSDFETTDVGITFRVIATVTSTGAIDMVLTPEVVEQLGYADLDDGGKTYPYTAGKTIAMPAGHRIKTLFDTRRMEARVTITPGKTLVLGGFKEPASLKDEGTGKRRLLLFVTPRLLTPDTTNPSD